MDFLRGMLTPATQYPAEPLKTETSRTPIPIPRGLCTALSAHVARWRGGGEHLLVGEAGDSGRQLGPWVLERALRDAREALTEADDEARTEGRRVDVVGLPEDFRFHDLRHYFASLLIAAGHNVKVVQARLRHASATTTLDTCGHLFPDEDEATRTTVEAVLVARADCMRTKEVVV